MSDRLLRLPEVKAETGLSRTSIYREMAAGNFPRPHQLTKRCVAWWQSEVEAWKATRPPVARSS